MLKILAGMVAAIALTACGADSAPAPAPAPSDGETELTIAVDAGERKRSFTLTCDPTGGTHPVPGLACEYLATAAAEDRDPFAPVPEDAACTMQYGGPETARVTGTWGGATIDARFSRTNGCEISRWDDARSAAVVRPRCGIPSPRPK